MASQSIQVLALLLTLLLGTTYAAPRTYMGKLSSVRYYDLPLPTDWLSTDAPAGAVALRLGIGVNVTTEWDLSGLDPDPSMEKPYIGDLVTWIEFHGDGSGLECVKKWNVCSVPFVNESSTDPGLSNGSGSCSDAFNSQCIDDILDLDRQISPGGGWGCGFGTRPVDLDSCSQYGDTALGEVEGPGDYAVINQDECTGHRPKSLQLTYFGDDLKDYYALTNMVVPIVLTSVHFDLSNVEFILDNSTTRMLCISASDELTESPIPGRTRLPQSPSNTASPTPTNTNAASFPGANGVYQSTLMGILSGVAGLMALPI